MSEPIPLGWRILLYLSHGHLMTVGQVAKMVGKDKGHIKRVIQRLQRAKLVSCHVASTRTISGYDVITRLYETTRLGLEVLNGGSDHYLRIVRTRTCYTDTSSASKPARVSCLWVVGRRSPERSP